MGEIGRKGNEGDGAVRDARRALGVVFFVNGAIFASWTARIPAVAGGLDLGPGALGLALLCQAAGTPVAMPVCGAAVARFGSRPAARAALLASCLALPFVALAPNAWALAAALALLGASVGSLVVAQNAQGVAVERALGRPVLNGLHGLLSLGWLAGSLVGAGAAGAGFSPLPHFVAAGSLLLGVGLLATRRLLPDRRVGKAEGPAFARPSQGLLMLAAISFCCLLAEGAALDWGAMHLGGTLGAGESLAALGPAAFAAAMTVGRLVGDRPAERLGVSSLVRGAGSLGALGMLLTAAADRPWLGLVGLGLLGAGLSVVFPVLLGVAGRSGGEPPGPCIATVATAGYVGLLAGPALIGAVAELSGLRVGLAVAALFVGLVPLLASRVGLGRAPTGPYR